ncbi:unnamed protein product, partial [Adineta steineri]
NQFGEKNDTNQSEESVAYANNEQTSSETDRRERHPSTHSVEQSLTEEYEVSYDTDGKRSHLSSFNLISTPQEERKQSLSQSEANKTLTPTDSSDQIKREEDKDSSLRNTTEENNLTDYSSSTITNDYPHHHDNLHETNPFPLSETNKQSSPNSSLTDVEDVDPSVSEKSEARIDDVDDPNLAIIMQDLRYVFHEIANDEDLVEIDKDLPDKLLDRLEFRDHIIRTLFDSLLRKYLVQAAAQRNRSETLDWVEFRDILFPMISGRYTEQHIRKLFDLFDTSGDGHLSVQEIAELLEVLQASDTICLAQNIVEAYDTDHDGKLSVDELIEAIKKTDDINEHVLSDETENQQWFNQSPTENQTITFEVPIITYPPRIEDKLNTSISLLGRIFKKLSANSENKQLDSNKKNLSIEMAVEFINNNINIPINDLQLFIQSFLIKKHNTDSFINWIEFRDIFLPIITNGLYTKQSIQQWFDIFDTNRNGIITQEQVIHLLRLLQIQNPENIIIKLNEIIEAHAVNATSWTFDELIVALEIVNETSTHLLTNIEQISSFDNDWLSNNIF